jgi:Major capsid protein 13-like
MAMSDLAVYSEYAYRTQTEILRQQLALFNEASRGALLLTDAAHQGDYSDQVFWGSVSGLVRRRNQYGSGAVTEKNLRQIVDTMVKVAAGTPPVRIDEAWLRWLQRDPAEAGVVLGKQLAVQVVADMVNTSVAALQAAMSQISGNIYDGTGDTPDTLNPIMMNNGQAKFGDAYRDLVCWLMHSGSLFQLWGNSLTNAEKLFTYGTVAVLQDAFGRAFIVSDIPALFISGSPNVYWAIGASAAAARVERNNDYRQNVMTSNGNENIMDTFQAEWSYEMGIKGFAWDKTNGGHSPTDAALLTASNWDRYATSPKDLPGILIKHN